MTAPLTDIANRLTPSVPLELTFGAQVVATGRKFATLFGHKAASGGSGADYLAYTVINVGDPVAAKAEVDALAGAGSQIGKMAAAFVSANSTVTGRNFPAFRVVLIPNAVTTFGPSQEAIQAVVNLRSDLLVSCYPASDSSNKTILLALQAQISGIDRDLHGQFGSFAIFGSIDILSTALAYNYNNKGALIAYMQDTNTALVTVNGDVTLNQSKITNIVTTGIYPGAAITGTAIPANTFAGAVDGISVSMVDATGQAVVATATHAAESIGFQNLVSQASEIVAAAHAGAMLQSAFPYNPLQGVVVGGLIPPRKAADFIQIDPNGSSEAALVAGLSPMYIQAGGTVAFIRTRTTFTLLPDNVTAATAYFDWQDLVTMNDFREDVYQITQNPPFNNNPGGTKASKDIADQLKDEILAEAQLYEDETAFQGVKSLASQFIVAPSVTSRGRFDFKIPINVLPGLFVIAGNIQGVTTFDFTL